MLSRSASSIDESLSAINEQAVWRYVVSGTVTWMVGESRIAAGPGTVIASRQPSGGRLCFPDTPVEYIWINLQGRAALDYFDFVTGRFGVIHRLPPRSEPVRLAEEMVRAARQNRPRTPFFWSERAFLWMSSWHRELEEARTPLLPMVRARPEDSRVLIAAMRSVKSFAAQVGYSPSHLTRLIGRSWRETPGRVLRRVRLEEAERMLRETGQPVAVIAGSVGYSSVGAFITAFRLRFGASPAAYRRSRR